MLYRIVYLSRASTVLDTAAIDALLADARRCNASMGITAALLYADDLLLQMIEGPKRAVLDLYERIARDTRHYHLRVVHQGPDEARMLPGCALAYEASWRTPELTQIVALARVLDEPRLWAGAMRANGDTMDLSTVFPRWLRAA